MHNPHLLPLFIFGTMLITAFGIAVVISLIIQKQRQVRNILARQQLAFQYSQSLLTTRIEVQETTLNMLAQELHDNITQMLTGCFIQLAATGECSVLSDCRAGVEEAKGNLKSVIGDVRQLSHSLATGLVEQRDIQDAIQAELSRIEKTARIRCELRSHSIHELQPDQRLIVFRAVQESLQNILKHAAAKHITVTIQDTEDRYHLTIADDGKGFDVAAAAQQPSLGLLNIRERVSLLKGTVALHSSPGSGTTVEISIPIQPEETNGKDKNSPG